MSPVEATSLDRQRQRRTEHFPHYFDVMFDVEKRDDPAAACSGQSTVILRSVTTTGDRIYRQNAGVGGR